MHSMGYRDMKEDDIVKLISEVDLNDNAVLEFPEFVNLMKNFLATGKENNFTKIVNKAGQSMFRVGEQGKSAFSTFSEEERTAFVKVINTVLCKDTVCKKYLPIDPETMDIFNSLKNGILLCKLINAAHPGTIDDRVINVKDNMNIFLMTENLKLALNAAKAIGCQIINVFSDTIINENYVLTLGVLWQIIKIVMLGSVNLKSHPQLIRLLNDGEEMSDLLKLNPEDLLLRWFNYHLKNAGHEKKITNFSGDLKDSEKYTLLLNQLNNKLCDKTALNESDLTKRANTVLGNSKKIGVESYITANDICSGNSKLNVLYTAAIFNQCHGLDDLTEQEQFDAAQLLNDDVEGSREERAFRMWINSLGLPDMHINNLYEDSKSGVLLLKVIDKVKPGSVEWKKVDEKSNNKFKKVVNCNEAVDACKKAHFTIVGIGGSDLNQGNKKYILAIVWQLMRAHTLTVIGNKTEDDLLKWANEVVGKDPHATSFKDKSLKNSLFFINIMNAIEPRAINWDIVIQGNILILNLIVR
jgi:plastin-1